MGVDLFAEGLEYAEQRTACPLVQGDVHMLPFGTHFNLIGLFDVLEHLPDDQQVLCDLYTLLADGGVLLLTVPAHPALWSYFDDASHHYRRYPVAELRSKLTSSGYRVEYLTQYMAVICPIVWLGRRLATIMHRCTTDKASRTRHLATNELRVVPVVNEILTWLLTWEARLIAPRCVLPFGTLLVAVARK